MRRTRVIAAAFALAVHPPVAAGSQGEGEAKPSEDGNGKTQPPPEGKGEAKPASSAEEGMPQPQGVDPEIFDMALDDFYAGHYDDAALGFYGYIAYGDQGAENYEWAQYLLAESLRNLGLWHAAVRYYYTVAKTRSRPEILPEALGRLQTISRHRPFSESLVFEDLIYDSDFGTLPRELDDWISYVQGLYDYRNRFIRWGSRHFTAISKEGAYSLKARFVEAVHSLRRKRDEAAVKVLHKIIDSPIEAPDIKNKAYLSLARLLFDNGKYERALENYGKVKQIELSFEQAELLLEMAWTAFNLKEYRRAMGLLHALNAPSYKRYFLPDAFLLRGLILKELCHFIPAKRVVREFRFHHGRALQKLHRRVPLDQISLIIRGATQTGQLFRQTQFMRSLRDERRLIEEYDSVWEDVGLDAHLRRLYDLEMSEQRRRWKADFGRIGDAVALELLETEEQVDLLDYEIGLEIFKRLKVASARKVPEEPLVVPYDSAMVYYEFDTEYWNDELHSYDYFATNRCFEDEAG